MSFVLASAFAGDKPDTPPVATEIKPKVSADGRDWPGIFRNMASADTVVRDAAVTDFLQALAPLAEKTKKPYFAKLIENINSKDAKVHDDAASRVKLIGQVLSVNDKSFKPLVAGLMSAEPVVRNEKLEYMFKVVEESLQSDHVRDLIEQLGSEKEETVKAATAELKTIGGDAADDLASALDEEKVQIKKIAADLLKDMGPAAKDAVNSLVFKIKDGDDKLGRKYAAQVLEALGPDAAEAVDDLVLSLDDDDKVLRRICADVLKKMGAAYKAAAPDLVNYLTHDDKAVRKLASELLLALGAEAKTGTKDLIDVIDEPAPVVQANVPPPANPLPGNDADSKVRAAKILASIGPDAKEALPGLKKFSEDKDPDLKDAVKEAIDKITEGKPIDDVIKTIVITPPPNPNAAVAPPKQPAQESKNQDNF